MILRPSRPARKSLTPNRRPRPLDRQPHVQDDPGPRTTTNPRGSTSATNSPTHRNRPVFMWPSPTSSASTRLVLRSITRRTNVEHGHTRGGHGKRDRVHRVVSVPALRQALEGRTSTAKTWLRCPRCGRASTDRPIRSPRGLTSRPVALMPNGRDEGTNASILRHANGRRDRRANATTREPRPPGRHPAAAAPANPVRVAIAAALFVAVVFESFAFLEGSRPLTIGGAFIVAVLLVLLTRPVPTPMRDEWH